MKLTTTSILTILFSLFALTAAHAEIQTQNVTYQDGDTELEGYLVWDDSINGKRPGVLLVHEWWGLNDYARKRAEMLAELGYVAFALDMYGKGKVTDHPDQAGEWSNEIAKNGAQWIQRAQSGLGILQASELVDSERMAAIGYCFGGSTVMQMAYAGANLDGVVSFHGALPLPPVGQSEPISSRMLIAHGNADAFIKPDHIAKFQNALEQVGADWQMVYYAGARHGFTNPDAGNYGIDNLKYDEKADQRSWEHMQRFFDELFSVT